MCLHKHIQTLFPFFLQINGNQLNNHTHKTTFMSALSLSLNIHSQNINTLNKSYNVCMHRIRSRSPKIPTAAYHCVVHSRATRRGIQITKATKLYLLSVGACIRRYVQWFSTKRHACHEGCTTPQSRSLLYNYIFRKYRKYFHVIYIYKYQNRGMSCEKRAR